MSISHFSDQELITLFISGQESSFDELFKRHKKRIYTAIYLLVKDHDIAADIFQDTALKILDTFRNGKYAEEGKFLPWALRIAHNLSIDHFRRLAKMPTVKDTDEGKSIFEFVNLKDNSAEEHIMHQQNMANIRALIIKLPEDQREVLVMRIFGELSFKEIADLTHVSINTALGRMRYALTNIRKMMVKFDLTF